MRHVLFAVLLAFQASSCALLCGKYCESHGGGGGLKPQPGGDCIVNVTPSTVAGPKFQVAFQANGTEKENGNTTHEFSVWSDDEDFVVGTGMTHYIPKKTMYKLEITNLETSPKIKLQADGPVYTIGGKPETSQAPNDGFRVWVRPDPTEPKILVYVFKGANGVSFEAVKPSS